METIKVNMNPNPLDVQTIHASQNDTEARQWGFELHNNGEVIDSSEVTDQITFKAYEGGTEQILPENGSVPTTSPFLGDIKYPQGLLVDQEFAYRQSPTESDGLAKIQTIYGNTLKWNQLISEQFSHTFTAGGSNQNVNIERINNIVAGHKYLYAITQANSMSSNVRNTLQYLYSNGSNVIVNESNATNHNLNAGRYGWIFTAPSDNANNWISLYYWCYTPNVAVNIKDAILVDLTLMFGAGNEPSTIEEFTSLFSLPYYAYNQGTLLSFNGNGIKTVGFNQWDEEWEVGGLDVQNGNPYTDNSRIRTKNFNQCFENTVYYNSAPQQAIILFYDGNFGYLGCVSANARSTFTTKANARYFKFYMATAYGTTYNNDICINISDTSKNGTYEPYTSSTLSLPISTYFPNGMKSAGSVYDELAAIKATTRIGAVDLGSLTWSYSSDAGHLRFVSSTISPEAKLPANTIANAVCTKYEIVTEGNVYNNQKVGLCIISNSRAMVYDPNYTDVTTFKNAMSGVYLYYELATPTETSFTTASLVTENAEIPLSNEDGTLIGKCTEQLSENPGFIDAKIKLSDSDGECYSNKLQLHVERSPQ